MARPRTWMILAVLIMAGLLGGGGLVLAGSSQSSQSLLATASALQTRAAQQQTVEATQTAAVTRQATPAAIAAMPPLDKVDKTWQPVWKAEQALNLDVAQQFCLNGEFQEILRGKLQINQTLKDAIWVWFDLEPPTTLRASGRNYALAYLAAQRLDPNVPSWAYPVSDQTNLYELDRLVIEALGQTKQYTGCDTGMYPYLKH